MCRRSNVRMNGVARLLQGFARKSRTKRHTSANIIKLQYYTENRPFRMMRDGLFCIRGLSARSVRLGEPNCVLRRLATGDTVLWLRRRIERDVSAGGRASVFDGALTGVVATPTGKHQAAFVLDVADQRREIVGDV